MKPSHLFLYKFFTITQKILCDSSFIENETLIEISPRLSLATCWRWAHMRIFYGMQYCSRFQPAAHTHVRMWNLPPSDTQMRPLSSPHPRCQRHSPTSLSPSLPVAAPFPYPAHHPFPCPVNCGASSPPSLVATRGACHATPPPLPPYLSSHSTCVTCVTPHSLLLPSPSASCVVRIVGVAAALHLGIACGPLPYLLCSWIEPSAGLELMWRRLPHRAPPLLIP
jgi:hypothetical protein